MTEAHGLWYIDTGRVECRSHRLEEPGSQQLQVRARFGALSRGTESLIFFRRVPSSEWPRMCAPFQWGSLPDPVSYGYVNVGEIVAGCERRVGEMVFCLYPHHTSFVVPHRDAHQIPPGVPPERAVLVANMETALNAIWDGDVRPGHRVQVAGAGVVGCLVAYLASRIPGTSVELTDINPMRASVAEALSVAFSDPGADHGGFDVVFECSGSSSALASLLPRLRDEGRAVVVSWYGRQRISLPLGEDFHSRRLSIVSSQVGKVSPAMRHLSGERRLALALNLLDDPALDVLFTHEVNFWDLPAKLPEFFAETFDGLCVRIVYNL